MTALTVRPATAADPDGNTSVLPADAPGPEAILSALLLSEILQHLTTSSSHLHALVASATGLRLGELRVLDAVAADTAELSEVAVRTGEPPAALRATLTALAASRHVTLTTPQHGRLLAEITESGRARLDQLAAIQLRLLAEMPPGVAEPLLAFAQPAQADIGPGGASR